MNLSKVGNDRFVDSRRSRFAACDACHARIARSRGNPSEIWLSLKRQALVTKLIEPQPGFPGHFRTRTHRSGVVECGRGIFLNYVKCHKIKRVNVTESGNYRGLALSSLFDKITDLIFLDKYPRKLSTSDLQFCLKPKRSADECMFVAKETIAYYLEDGGSLQSTMRC